ncbi:unnamed protein product [Amoebophrya sp. A25]|nr:unnamed protein product [Amoebophrya sp. A25]|eukprot:GSA25T00018257001.1
MKVPRPGGPKAGKRAPKVNDSTTVSKSSSKISVADRKSDNSTTTIPSKTNVQKKSATAKRKEVLNRQDAPVLETNKKEKFDDSQRGSCFQSVRTMVSDEWQTCRSAWKAVARILLDSSETTSSSSSASTSIVRKTSRIWQPFYYDGLCRKHLLSLGFKNVHHRPGEDFFEFVKNERFLRNKVDFIWDNPPYTTPEMKHQVLKALADCGKPFCLLLPIAVLHSAYARELLDMSQVQVMFPRRVMVRKKNQKAVPFKLLIWLCYKMKLPRDVYFLEDEEEDEKEDTTRHSEGASDEEEASDEDMLSDDEDMSEDEDGAPEGSDGE